ncbi:MAG TPA: Nif3-like dinuclear metal center hexameric protein [Gaiellaceae bacterium]|nr:Nif3-like dinuclear metal center hexameric protein [Gaiellaceae bacterium]
MADRDELLAFADELLDLDAYPDYGPMGMQVEGAREVQRIATGVSASLELFEQAARAGAQLLLVHHGLFWDRDPRVVAGPLRRRLQALFDADITLAAYHLALDAHSEVGNNALLARELGIEPEQRFADLGWGGPLRDPVDIEGFAARVRQAVDAEPIVFAHGPDRIDRAAVVTGGAARYVADAAQEGYDLFLTGEADEPTLHTARELGIHFVAGGHYATERIGIKALGELLAERFGIESEFIELPNPV